MTHGNAKPMSREIRRIIVNAKRRASHTLVYIDSGRLVDIALTPRTERLIETRTDDVIGVFDHRATATDLRHAMGIGDE